MERNRKPGPECIRKAQPKDAHTVAELMAELWPKTPAGEFAGMETVLAEMDGAVFLCETEGRAAGFAECSLRHDYVEGTRTSPVGYLEGIYVREADRHRGIARRLLEACEKWAAEQGCREFASDCELTNTESQAFHQAVGFREVNRIVAYTRKLS